jgi:ABC-type transporter Mla subunit MlaD
MSRLSELNKAINALNDVWPLLEGEERQKILTERNNLNEMASELSYKTLLEEAPELTEAIDQLNKVTQSANATKASIDHAAERINMVADTTEKAVSAAAKVAALIAIL